MAYKVDSIVPVPQKVAIKVFPNPVKNKAVFRLSNYDPGLVQVQIADVSGNIVYNEMRLVVLKTDEITVFFQLKPGLYWCWIKQKNRVAKLSFTVVI